MAQGWTSPWIPAPQTFTSGVVEFQCHNAWQCLKTFYTLTCFEFICIKRPFLLRSCKSSLFFLRTDSFSWCTFHYLLFMFRNFNIVSVFRFGHLLYQFKVFPVKVHLVDILELIVFRNSVSASRIWPIHQISLHFIHPLALTDRAVYSLIIISMLFVLQMPYKASKCLLL